MNAYLVLTLLSTGILAQETSTGTKLESYSGFEPEPIPVLPIAPPKRTRPRNELRTLLVPELYLVTGAETSLGEIAIRLYGNFWAWRRIARWNELPPPFPIEIGDRLKLFLAPTISRAEGDFKLLVMWRKQLDLREKALLKAEAELSQRERRIVEQEKARVAKESEKKAAEQAIAIAKIEEETKAKEEKGEYIEKSDVQVALEDPTSAESYFSTGQEAFNSKEYEKALASFTKSREKDADPLPPWFYEIRVLRLLNRVDDAKSVAKLLVEKHPEVKDLPMLQFVNED